jgi:formate hydrogenlyase subunit 3/multisubunit Na+/H+ antiporter MnhD subunit
MVFVIAFIGILIATLASLPLFKMRGRAVLFYSSVIVNAIITSYFSIQTLFGESFEVVLPGSIITGAIPIRLDALSGWFILIINLVFITGGFYGIQYLKAYKEKKNSITLHGIAFIILHSSLLSLCVVQNSFAFLIAWEIMALSAFTVVIFEHEKIPVIKAGINYLIQSHVAIVFLMLGFMWVYIKTGSYDFQAISTFTENSNIADSLVIFVSLFLGFSLKAGFVPLHTWLPYAHPAAPAHISGIMSGVIIKIGIFGILRFIPIVKTDYLTIGYFLLIVSVVSSLYGVMLAIVQHNLKRLLAYHSIENIGIIGIGISIGCIGLGNGNPFLSALGFAGALLHTLNHALFKSLLFYTAGNVYQATHSLNIEQLGGVIKKMPQTSLLFLIAAIAICGIPPFNGFISEFVIYSGLYHWLHNALLVSLVVIIFTILALVMVGGLAMLCFTKAFGIVFLGEPRHEIQHEMKEVPFTQLIPLYVLASIMLFIGTSPKYILSLLEKPVGVLTGNQFVTILTFQGKAMNALQPIGWAALVLILMIALIYFIRNQTQSKRSISIASTWGCGYVAPTVKQQYTAGSFVRSYGKLFGVIILWFKKEDEISEVFPTNGHFESHTYDKIEKWVIDKPIIAYKSFMGRFIFLQNGKLQYYILYGIIFIVSIICIPLIYEKLLVIIDFLKQL